MRQREFDTDEVLAIAMELFWQLGYANTSMKDIVQATGIQPGSLYAAFGDKEKLFQQALKKYTQEFFRASMPRHRPPLECIQKWFEHLAKAMTNDSKHKGCLIINTAVERESHSPSTIAIIEDRLDEIESFFRQNLAQALQDGDLPDSFEVEIISKALLGVVVGMLAIARIRHDAQTFSSIAAGAIALLPIK
ncbi:TetR/AcrR family transcriptional regulator [Calothrix sp. PCC 7507]|uniref:TetR/AcrR family transcriptional regulator n=1 Tax=Calothrix sp. PCC 7507 TaxID=99598 RepID=UPI00029EF100|nr:TetR/AcrR family transcriptional regulator [Calothrix sp. PCC 7507]AFY32174.1 regulatory protein TetR [Calothrix sp. PCC 7507]